MTPEDRSRLEELMAKQLERSPVVEGIEETDGFGDEAED
jgi:hypothetical protein